IDKVPILLGKYEGFFQDAATGRLGVAHSFIDHQANRRFQGFALLSVGEDQPLFNAINFIGTVTGADFVTGTGQALTGRVVFQGDLLTSEGVTGDAAAIEPTFRFVPPKGNPVDVAT